MHGNAPFSLQFLHLNGDLKAAYQWGSKALLAVEELQSDGQCLRNVFCCSFEQILNIEHLIYIFPLHLIVITMQKYLEENLEAQKMYVFRRWNESLVDVPAQI